MHLVATKKAGPLQLGFLEHGTRMWVGTVCLGVFPGNLLCNGEVGREEEKPTEDVPRMLCHGRVRPSHNKGPCDPAET